MKLKKIIYISLGCVSAGLGALGAVMPLMPAFPFLMLAAFCFGKSSNKLHQWFTGTKLYKNNLESFVKGNGMTVKTKFRIILIVTLTLAFGFFMMQNVPIVKILLSIVWVCHVLYFVFGIKTLVKNQSC